MATSLQMAAHFFNLCSNKHQLLQFLAKFWASTAHIKGMVALQTYRQSQNESTFQHNSSIFSSNITLRSLYCNFKSSHMLRSSIVIQITRIQLSTTSWLWDIQWKPYIDIFPGRPPCIYTIWPAEVESYSSCTAITHFLTAWTYT